MTDIVGVSPLATGLSSDDGAASVSTLRASIPNAHWKDRAGPLLITTNAIAGELASWAVQQSPYGWPDGLQQALADFNAAWPTDPDMADILPMRHWNSYGDLYAALHNLFCNTPSIAAWNTPKSGHGAQIVFSSRYDNPAPDDDFIDLGALANNVARECWKDALADKGFDDHFEEERAAQAIEARSGETEGLDRNGESAVPQGCANGQSHD
jgi:hypothetical protein